MTNLFFVLKSVWGFRRRCQLGLSLPMIMTWIATVSVAQAAPTAPFQAEPSANIGFPEIPPIVINEQQQYDERLNSVRQTLRQANYQPWRWGQGRCQNCPIFILPKNLELESERVYAFIQALEDRKAEITEMYHSDGQEYNLLARLAVGILGRESHFFTSPRYVIKENSQWAVSVAKIVRNYVVGIKRPPMLNSRGPTQIKIIPGPIAEKYKMTPDDLYIPENAAIATMGYLIEALAELKRRVAMGQWTYITPETYGDYLPYIYFGSKRQLVNGTATPDQNLYIRDMRVYMSWIEIYEGPARQNPVHP